MGAKEIIPDNEKKTKVEEAPYEDYFKPDVKISALGAPVIKYGNIRGLKGAKKVSTVGMKPLSDYWAVKLPKGKLVLLNCQLE